MIRRAFYIVIVPLLLFVQGSFAQYYSWGADPTTTKWRTLKSDNLELIYPDTVDGLARRTLFYLECVQRDITTGFEHKPLNFPFVLHPENFESNGLVMWLPKRVEFLTTPEVDGFSTLWLKHLVAHEYRHVVQYSNLNQKLIKVASYILGQQGSALGLLLMPVYALEGDAVMMETSMSSFGRALQPSFSMGYRAIGRDMLTRRNVDKWFSGSYQEFVPDHYKLGYQLTSYAYTKYGENVWNKVVHFAVRRPYYIVTTSTAFKKFYDTDVHDLMKSTFTDLFDYWGSLPPRPNSMEVISQIDTSNYTTYSHPIAIDGGVVALKSDYKRPARFVLFDTQSDTERLLSYIGSLSTRPTYSDGRLWWSEYRSSMLFEQRVNSRLCYMDLEMDQRGELKASSPRSVRSLHNLLYPTAMGSSRDRVAYVEYNTNGHYSIVQIEIDTQSNIKRELSRVEFPLLTEIHGLAWDNKSEGLYFIATSDEGMWLGALDNRAGYRALTQGAYITLSDLRAQDGVLYFGSIESGYDELHSYDLGSGVERRLSRSQYGSFDPSTPKDGSLYATTYDKYGYHLSRQSLEGAESVNEIVEPGEIAQNIVNPKRDLYDVINLDTVRFTAADSLSSEQRHQPRRYNKGLKLFNVHSWMPVAYNPLDFDIESFADLQFGATLISQNRLSNTEAYLSYGYSGAEGSIIRGEIRNNLLGVELSINGRYGGDQVSYFSGDTYLTDGSGGAYDLASIESYRDRFYSLGAEASLPLLFDCGYRKHTLSLSSAWSYSNGLIPDYDNIVTEPQTGNKLFPLDVGLHKVSFGAGYSQWSRAAVRDAVVPTGYSIYVNYALSPSNRYFRDLVGVYGKLYLRGFAPNNHLSIAANYQTSIGGERIEGVEALLFQSVMLLPSGYSSSDVVNMNYVAAALDYQFPIWHPEGGIGSILYVKRLRLNLGFDAARFDRINRSEKFIYSYGGDLFIDMNLLRMPQSGTTALQLSLYGLSEGGVSASVGFALPF